MNSLPTLYLSFPERRIYKYCYYLDGIWHVENYVTIYQLFRAAKWYRSCNIPARFSARSSENRIGLRVLNYLNLFSKRLSDRFQENV